MAKLTRLLRLIGPIRKNWLIKVCVEITKHATEQEECMNKHMQTSHKVHSKRMYTCTNVYMYKHIHAICTCIFVYRHIHLSSHTHNRGFTGK